MTTSSEPVQIRSFLACLFTQDAPPDLQPEFPVAERSEWIAQHHGRVHFWFRQRRRDVELSGSGGEDRSWLLGDTAEWNQDSPLASMVNAVPIRLDQRTGALELRTSIAGLPPVFLYRDSRCAVLSSDVHLIASLPHVRLELDPTAVEQLARIGHPIDHRTLYKATQLVACGAAVTLGGEGGCQVTSAWKLPLPHPTSWETFIEAQIAAFNDAMRRLDVSRSVLSLTAGLDTRAVFAALARDGRLVPAVTISGEHPSLDAIGARELCKAYGISHQLITLDDNFRSSMPELVEEASRLSGGLESVEQAPEVFFNRQLRTSFSARLSGNLGNQIGRGGTEGIGVRGASTEILSPTMRELIGDPDSGHWLLTQLDEDETSALAFILQQEIPSTSVANFSVGNHFAVQQSPYANRTLLETLLLKPIGNNSAPSGSKFRMRMRDLNHRFFGDEAFVSFQRTLLQRIGGVAARYPINYGWRASGGLSPIGLARGVATLAGAVAQKIGLEDGFVGGALEKTGVPALHGFLRASLWLRRELADYTRDILGSKAVLEAGIFDTARLQQILQQHYSRAKDHHETISFALDVALAYRIFCNRR